MLVDSIRTVCPNPLYTATTGSLCYWVPDKENKVKFNAALDVCKKEGGQLAALELRQQLDHVNRTDVLLGTECKR